MTPARKKWIAQLAAIAGTLLLLSYLASTGSTPWLAFASLFTGIASAATAIVVFAMWMDFKDKEVE